MLPFRLTSIAPVIFLSLVSMVALDMYMAAIPTEAWKTAAFLVSLVGLNGYAIVRYVRNRKRPGGV